MANLFQAQGMLGGYYASGPWQESLKLKITGKLSEKLSVSYDLEQQQDLPDRHNVQVTYDKTQLNFGDFQATFGGNEFASATKSLNGVMVTSKDNWYDMILVPSSKLKSYTQFLATQRGNNTMGPYNLGHNSIIEGSEIIELNNVKLRRHMDYTIDYFEGKVTFKRILSPEDEIKYIYEYTNIIDLFFPTVSKRDFIGLRFDVKQLDQALWGEEQIKPEKSVRKATEFFPTMLKLEEKEPPKIKKITVPTEVSTRRSDEGVSPATNVLIGSMAVMKLYDSTAEAIAEQAELSASKIDELLKVGVSSNEVEISPMGEGFAVIIKGDIIVIADQFQARAHNTSAEALAKLWKDSLITGFSNTMETRTIVITPEAEILEEFEWESTGVYKLLHIPLLPFSEVIYFKGTELKKFEDYIIDYQDGTITLFSHTLPTPTEPLRVDYRYIEIATEAEILPGAGFGPYHLSHKDIILGSEVILVNNIPYVRDLDYVINYVDGTVLFATSISPTSNIQIKYKHIVMIKPPPPVTPKVPMVWSAGGTYMEESGKSGAVAPSITYQESFTGSEIIADNNTIYLAFWPIPTSESVILTINGVVATYEVDYVFPTYEASTGSLVPPTELKFINYAGDQSDGFDTGTIKYVSPTTLEAGDQIVVSYAYSKRTLVRHVESGAALTVYEPRNMRDIVPGTERVFIWRKGESSEVQLKPNTSTEATSDSHYSMNYTNPPKIRFNDNPLDVGGVLYDLSNIYFRIEALTVPQGTISQTDISRKLYGIDTNFTQGDIRFSAAIAKSETDQLYLAVTTNETFSGTGTQSAFQLHSQNKMIEGSERVFVNNIKLNEEIQYYMAYDRNGDGTYGRITFYAIQPSTQDVISIDYDYEDASGFATQTLKQGSAYAASLSMKPFKEMEFSIDGKRAEATFDPLGGTSIPIGADYSHIYSKITPLHNFWISGDYKQNNNPIGNPNDRQFLHSYDTNIGGGFNPYGLAQIDFSHRNYNIIDDVVGGSPHQSDSQLYSYSLNITPQAYRLGQFSFAPSTSLSRTMNLNNISSQDSTVDFGSVGGAFEFTRTKLNLGYQVNKTLTTTREPGSGPIEKREANDLSSSLNLDLTFAPIRRLSTYWNRQGHNEYDFIGKTVKSTLNETYHLDFVPIDPLTTSINHDRQETLTIFTALGNPKTERTTVNMRLIPYTNTSVNVARSVDNSIQETGTRTSGWLNTYTINHTPISEQLYSVSTNYTLLTSSRKVPGSGVSSSREVQTDTKSFSQGYGLTITPITNLSFSGGYVQEDYFNANNDIASPVETRSKNQTFNLGTAYKATRDLDLSANYSHKVTVTQTESPQKLNFDFHAAQKVFTHGTLNYDWTQEENGGEILSGSLANQDFLKNIHSVALNVVFPQTGETVLSSIVVRVAYKWAFFKDRKNDANSFDANSLSFEGSLNF
ncbi:hypothetical protein ACFLZ2_02195 [Candidatus Margulisiibacteriota bacterium]